jgi:hypothetical protein
VNGYANGWRVPAGTDIEVELTWVPQRTVRALTLTSVGFVLLALVLVVLPRGRRRDAAATAPEAPEGSIAAADDDATSQGDGTLTGMSGPGLPQPLRWSDAQRYPGATPSPLVQAIVVVAAAATGALIVSPAGAAVLAVAAIAGVRAPRSRPLVLGAALALFAGSVGLLAGRQLVSPLPAGFDWPTYFDGLRGSAWTAVLLLALDPVLERVRTGRSGPFDPSTPAT